MKEKIGIIDVGGGLRGIYAAGVLDYCLEAGIHFDLGIGVSAGSANLASFTARQKARNYQFYTEFAMRKEYMGMSNYLKKKSFIDLDYVYSTLSNSDGESPLDYHTIMQNPMEMLTVATEDRTGNARYFAKQDLSEDAYHIFKASSAIPFVCRPYTIKEISYYDGALADPVPIEKAFELGCSKVILILTLPKHQIRSAKKDVFLANRIYNQYPLSAEKLASRAERYNSCVALAKEYEKSGKMLIIAPDNTCGVNTLSRKPEALHQLYQKGYHDSHTIKTFLNCL